jgi:hypothetical protein
MDFWRKDTQSVSSRVAAMAVISLGTQSQKALIPKVRNRKGSSTME